MARSKKTTTPASKNTEVGVAEFDRKRKNDVILAWGFAVQTDTEFSPTEGKIPTKAQLLQAEDGMFLKYEEQVLAALEAVFGPRVTFVEVGGSYTGDPKTGIEKRVRIAPVEEVEPEEPGVNNLDQMTVKELRQLAKDNGLKTQGSKAALVKRLENVE